ncbi:hypothetical protein DL93DRAFT_2171537 [Clavulina sp. PMI_390]|nr:hypothetical protein DL93DRAFT_2171537 [Clavulina sp. PMI_390]
MNDHEDHVRRAPLQTKRIRRRIVSSNTRALNTSLTGDTATGENFPQHDRPRLNTSLSKYGSKVPIKREAPVLHEHSGHDKVSHPLPKPQGEEDREHRPRLREKSIAKAGNKIRPTVFNFNKAASDQHNNPFYFASNSNKDSQELNRSRLIREKPEPTMVPYEEVQKSLMKYTKGPKQRTRKIITGKKPKGDSVQAGDRDHHSDNDDSDNKPSKVTVKKPVKKKLGTKLPPISKGGRGHNASDEDDSSDDSAPLAVTLKDFYKGAGKKSKEALPKKLPLSILKAHLLRQARQYNAPSARSASVDGGVFRVEPDEIYGFESFYKTNNGHHRDALSRLDSERVSQLYAGFADALQGAVDSARKVMRRNYNLQAKQWKVSPANINYVEAERKGELYRMDDEYNHVPYDEKSPAKSMLHQLRNFAVSLAGDKIYGEKVQEMRRREISACRRRIQEEHRIKESDELPTRDLDERQSKELHALQHLVQQYDLHKEMAKVQRIRNVRTKKPLVQTASVLQNEEAQLRKIVNSKLSGGRKLNETDTSVLVGHEAMEAWFAAEGKGAVRARAQSVKPRVLEARELRRAERAIVNNYVTDLSTQAQEQALNKDPVLVHLRQFILNKRAMEHFPSGANANEVALAYSESKTIGDRLKDSIKTVKQQKIKMEVKLDALTTVTKANLRDKLDAAEERVRKGERQGMLPQDQMLNDLRDFYFKLRKATNRTGKETPQNVQKYHEEAEDASRKITTYQTQTFRPPHFYVDPRVMFGKDMPRELALLMSIKEDYDLLSSLDAQRSSIIKGTWKGDTPYKPLVRPSGKGSKLTAGKALEGVKTVGSIYQGVIPPPPPHMELMGTRLFGTFIYPRRS